MLRRAIERFWIVVKDEGVVSAITKLVGAVRQVPVRENQDAFDAAWSTDTSIEVPLWRLEIPSENAKFGGKYQTTAPTVFLEALKTVPTEPSDLVFVDLGCGKGRTLILAAGLGFRRIVGVEFSPELSSTARANIARVGVTAEVHEMDVCKFEFPDDGLLIYMFNPFGSPVMSSVLGNLVEWRRQSGNPAFIVYMRPVHEGLLEASDAFQRIGATPDASVWRLV